MLPRLTTCGQENMVPSLPIGQIRRLERGVASHRDSRRSTATHLEKKRRVLQSIEFESDPSPSNAHRKVSFANVTDQKERMHSRRSVRHTKNTELKENFAGGGKRAARHVMQTVREENATVWMGGMRLNDFEGDGREIIDYNDAAFSLPRVDEVEKQVHFFSKKPWILFTLFLSVNLFRVII